MVPEDTIPTNIYTSSYLRQHTVQYGSQSGTNQSESQTQVS